MERKPRGDQASVRMNDLSSYDSAATELSARKRVPPKKRPMQLLNVFSSDSSDSEDDDDEVRTLSGSQSLSICSLGSPTFGTQEEHLGSKKFLKLSKVAAPIFPQKQPDPHSKPKTIKAITAVDPSEHKIVRALAPKISLDNSEEKIENFSAATAVDLTMTPDRDTARKKNEPVVATSKATAVKFPKPRASASKISKAKCNQSVLVQATKTTDQKAPASSKAKVVKRITAKLSKAAYDLAEKSKVDSKENTSNPNAAKSLLAPQSKPLVNVAKPPQVPRKGSPTLEKTEVHGRHSKSKKNHKIDNATSQPVAPGVEPKKRAKSSQATATEESSQLKNKDNSGTLNTLSQQQDKRSKVTVSVKAKVGCESASAKGNTSNAKDQKSAVKQTAKKKKDITKKTKPGPPSNAVKPPTPKEKVEQRSSPNKKRVASNSKSSNLKPPAVKKSKKLSFQDQVVNKLFWSFKPFTVRSLCDELKATDSTVEFCMLSLVDKGVAKKKDFTSAKGRVKTLYWANHDTKSKEVNVGTETSAAERHETKQQVQDLQSQEARLNQQLAVTLQQPSNADLSNSLALAEGALMESTQMVQAMKDRIDAHKSHAANSKKRGYSVISKHDCSPTSMKVRINHMRHEWVKRKAKCRDFVELLADGMEKKPKDVIKLLDIETDESCDAAVPPKHQVI